MAGKKGRGPGKLVEPISLLGAMLLELMGAEEGALQPASTGPASSQAPEEHVLQLRMPDGRIEREPLLGGFWRIDRTGGLTLPRIVTRHEGSALVGKQFRIAGGKALYAGTLKATGARAFDQAGPGETFRYRNASLRRMTPEELAAAVTPEWIYGYGLLGEER